MKNSSYKILFICKGNWFRSQIAAALYNKITNSYSADSAGTFVGAKDEPEGMKISEAIPFDYFFDFMESRGMNIRDNRTTKLTPKMLESYDKIISMAEEPYIPDYVKYNKNVIWWDVENPEYITKETVEDTYNKIDSLVRKLF